MRLSQKRHKFLRMKQLLIAYAEYLGFFDEPRLYVVEDEGKRCSDCPNTHPQSTHKVGLAIDLIIYNEDWEPVWDSPLFAKLHDYWDFIGGAERITGDLGHFSLEHQGVR